jgi:hypothetical protein
MATCKIYRKSDPRKAILKLTALAIVVSGLFPPWLYVFDTTGTKDDAGGHWEVSAGYSSLFRPPNTLFLSMTDKELARLVEISRPYHAPVGTKLDVSRLLVEWVCLMALSGAAWGLVMLNKEPGPEPG